MDDLFPGFETEAFPVDSCTIQNKIESEVFDSDEVYLCVLASSRWPNECKVDHMRPYLCKEGHSLSYGWVSIETGRPVMHVTKPIWPDATRVIAWKKVDSFSQFAPEKWPTETEHDHQPHQDND